LDRITEVVNKFLECGDYTQAPARIACTNPNCDYGYFDLSPVRVLASAHPAPKRTTVWGRF